MTKRLFANCVLILLAWCIWVFAPAQAGEYAELFKRQKTHQRGETHARFAADLVLLGRSDIDSNGLLFADSTLTTPVLDAADLVFEDIPTGRYDLVLTDDTPYELQLSLFGFPASAEARALRTSRDIVAGYYGLASAPAGVVGSETFGVVYETAFGSGEVNLRKRLGPRSTVLAGFRHFGLQEDLWFIALEEIDGDTREITGLRTNVDNALYGFQLGLENTLWSTDRWQLVVVGKSGVYGNHMEVFGAIPDPADSSVLLTLNAEDHVATFAGEIQCTLVVPLGGGSLRLGYQFFGISDAALATDQSDNFDIVTGAGVFDVESVTYHGGFLGIEIPF